MLSKFLDADWQVFATTRQPEQLQDLTHTNLHVLAANVASKEGREKLVAELSVRCPDGLDCLINNAGYGLVGPLELLSEEQIRQQFEVNVFAPLLLIHALLPSLRQAKGRVINLSSVVGIAGLALHSVYSSSKFALEGLSESLSYELSSHGVQTCLVEPGVFRTRFASNINWSNSELSGDTSIYLHHLQGFTAFWKKVSNKSAGKDPAVVAEDTFRLANMKRMPLRHRVGWDAHALYFVRRLFPQPLADRVLQMVNSHMLEGK